MKISDLFRNVAFIIGFILGICLLLLCVVESINNGFRFEFIYYYVVILALTFVSAESDSGFMFFIGLGIPWLLITLVIFAIVDSKNKKERKPYRKWEL